MDIPSAQKARTISHMNKDHRTDLAHILQHSNNLTATPDLPLMTDIDLHSLTVTVGPTTHKIPFTPPLQSWDERRTRLIEMTMAAREALGIPTEVNNHGEPPKITINTYLPPRGADWIPFIGVCTYYVSYAAVKAGVVAKGSLLWGLLEGWFPGGFGGFRWLVETIFLLVVGIHVVEMGVFQRTRAGRYGVRKGSGAWWLWMGSVFLEGVGAFWRFDRAVRGEEKRRRG